MKMRTEYTCPLELVHDMVKGKWKPIILWRLRLGATSLAKLERDIDGITQKMLLEQLKELMDLWKRNPTRDIRSGWNIL
jgi:DNA-binding HxlR family transcriptional regulator